MEWLYTAVVSALIYLLIQLTGGLNEEAPDVKIEVEAVVSQDCPEDQPQECPPNAHEGRVPPLNDGVLSPSGRVPEEGPDTLPVPERSGTSDAPLRAVYWLSYRPVENVGGEVRP